VSATLVIVLSLLAAPPEKEPLKLAAPGFSGVDISEAQATFFSDHFAQQLNLRGVQVTTSSQIGALLGFERQRQLLGCKETSGSCMAELAAALGVDGVITGSVGKFDQTYQVNVSVVSSRDGRSVSAFSRKVNGSSAVLDALNDAAAQMARELPVAFQRPLASPSASQQIVKGPPGHQPNMRPPESPLAPSPTPAPAPLTLRDWFWLPSGLGVLFGAGSTMFFLQAKGAADELELAINQPQQHPLTYDQALAVRSRGVMGSTLGISMAAMSAIGLGIGGYFFFAGGPSQPSSAPISLQVTPGPTGLVISGVFR